MGKAILICGKICSGKSTYAARLQKETNAVLLSVDEIMLDLFGLYAGEKHDEYTEKIQKYLFEKSIEITNSGSDVVLDWGFWTKQKRTQARSFYSNRNIECELHYVDVNDAAWAERIAYRNKAVQEGTAKAYIIDSGLMKKFERSFEPPSEDEIDVRISQ